jgi:putative phosphoribosyl transferase
MISESQIVPIRVPIGTEALSADLALPPEPQGLVIFAHGSGSSRYSPRNQFVARTLQARGFATLLADLLTERDEAIDRTTAVLRFDIELLGRRVVALIDWARAHPDLRLLPIGLFGASTGAAAAIVAAAARPRAVSAIVSRGGRPDLAGSALRIATAPTLLLVGGLDSVVIDLNRDAGARMRAEGRLEIVSGATHLFEEPGTLERVAARAGEWFANYLRPPGQSTDARKRQDVTA